MATVYDVIVNYKLNSKTSNVSALSKADKTAAQQRARNDKWLAGVKQRSMMAEQRQWERNEKYRVSTNRRSIAAQTKLQKAAAKSVTKTMPGGGKGAGFMLADAFRWVGLSYLAFNAISGIKGALIDFSTTLESTRISMATGLFGFGKVGSFTEGLEKGKKLVEDYRKTAAAGVGELKDYTAMHGALQGSVFAAGGNLNQVTDMTKGGVVASSALGVEGWKASQDIAQMVRGNVTERDFTAKQLIEMRFKDMGIATGGDALGKFREMFKEDSKARLKFIQEALTSKTLKEAQKAYEGSMQGRIDQFTDNVKLALAQVGEGLFEGVKGTLTDINKWISENPTKIRDIAKQIGEFAVSLFNGVKTIVRFIYEWSGVILSAAKALLAYAIMARATAAYGAVRGAVAGGGAGMSKGGMLVGAALIGTEIGSWLANRTEKNGNTGRENTTAFYTALAQGTQESKMYLRVKREERLAVMALNRAIDLTANQVGLLGSVARKNALEVEILFAQDEEVKKFEGVAARERARLEKANKDRAYMGLAPLDVEAQVQMAVARARAADPTLAGKIEKRETMQQAKGRGDDFAKRGVDFMGRETKSKQDIAMEMVDKATGGAFSKDDVTAKIGQAMMAVDKANLAFSALANKYFSLKKGVDDQTFQSTLDAKAVADWVIAQLTKTVEGQKAAADASAATTTAKKGGSMNVTINRIQVESNDPERFVYGMREAFSDAVRNPSQAKPFIKKMGGGR